MIVRNALLVAGAAALMTTPAWALPSQAPSNQGTAHAPTTHASHRSGDHPGRSHKCKPHKVAYVASGLLVSQTLSKDGGPTPTTTTSKAALHKNADGTYSGDVTVDVKHTNHHAAGDKGKTVTYSVSHVRVTFALADVNNDGSSGLDDLQAGDRVKLIGRITALAKKCDHSTFTATTTIRHIVFHAPPEPKS